MIIQNNAIKKMPRTKYKIGCFAGGHPRWTCPRYPASAWGVGSRAPSRGKPPRTRRERNGRTSESRSIYKTGWSPDSPFVLPSSARPPKSRFVRDLYACKSASQRVVVALANHVVVEWHVRRHDVLQMQLVPA